MSLGTNISRLRAEKHLSQGDLAELLDVSRQSVSKWETDGSVPDLDKLVKLSRVFDVTLDELVTGEAPAAAQPAAAPQSFHGYSGGKIAGTILLCMAFLAVLVGTVAGGRLTGLFVCIPFSICGVICFLAQKHPGLWCAWAVYLTLELDIRWATGISWQLTLRTFSLQNYTCLLIAWVQLIAMLVMFTVTLHSFRHTRFPLNRRNFLLLGGGWAVLAGLYALKIWGYWQMMQIPNLNHGLGQRLLLRCIDLTFLVGFAALLTATVCALRSWRRRRKGTF
ncbi:helix-turn-helix domain-containing protein [Dysosmobacter sp.]|uniref:helix-turn-helix domain-containing protein n=1 Tax=Dysosmobacter sp. TaxID=2591382 RepID=UPI002AA023D4|nr:helix-turn-helix transcriptional regulator [Dysosmobacter sp.]MCI6054237.1 helix-turn-helix domain-containing protein [Dysosmobacter sp.]MDY5511256.1 helix-turn-helix transcriptional regulator [Dysosmobacter sp.]